MQQDTIWRYLPLYEAFPNTLRVLDGTIIRLKLFNVAKSKMKFQGQMFPVTLIYKFCTKLI